MTKNLIIDRIWKKTKLTRKQSGQIVDNIIDEMKRAIVSDKKLKITRFGVFEIKKREARKGRNPRTQIEALIKAAKVLRFKPSRNLKKRVDNSSLPNNTLE